MNINENHFENVCFDGHDFSSKCHIGIRFKNCSLRYCDFSNSDLSYAVFESCDMYRATFSGAVLYTTRLIDCDATKVNFEHAYLNGLRASNINITHACFGHDYCTGAVRKSHEGKTYSGNWLSCKLGDKIGDISQIEKEYSGILCESTSRAISFDSHNNEVWRKWRRKSEISKTIQKIYEENGYRDKSLEYYYWYRVFFRKSSTNRIWRVVDYVFGGLVWGYGVKAWNPVIAFFVNAFVFSLLYACLPVLIPGSGIMVSGNLVSIIDECNLFNPASYFNSLYGSLLISSLSVFGSVDMAGYGKMLAVVQVLVSILTMGLGISSLTKKMANI